MISRCILPNGSLKGMNTYGLDNSSIYYGNSLLYTDCLLQPRYVGVNPLLHHRV